MPRDRDKLDPVGRAAKVMASGMFDKGEAKGAHVLANCRDIFISAYEDVRNPTAAAEHRASQILSGIVLAAKEAGRSPDTLLAAALAGLIHGSTEVGAEPGRVAVACVEAVRSADRRRGIDSNVAFGKALAAVLQAAAEAGTETAEAIRQALSRRYPDAVTALEHRRCPPPQE